MPSPSVHVKADKSCACGKVFSKQDMTLTLHRVEVVNGTRFIVRQLCCTVCYEAHYSKGE